MHFRTNKRSICFENGFLLQKSTCVCVSYCIICKAETRESWDGGGKQNRDHFSKCDPISMILQPPFLKLIQSHAKHRPGHLLTNIIMLSPSVAHIILEQLQLQDALWLWKWDETENSKLSSVSCGPSPSWRRCCDQHHSLNVSQCYLVLLFPIITLLSMLPFIVVTTHMPVVKSLESRTAFVNFTLDESYKPDNLPSGILTKSLILHLYYAKKAQSTTSKPFTPGAIRKCDYKWTA